MFRKKEVHNPPSAPVMPVERVTTVLGSGTTYKGSLSGSGGARIEGAFEGEISLRGMLVIGATGRVTCPHVKANMVIVAGALRGDITAEKVEIRSSGRVWGNVVTSAFSTEEGAFLRGQIQMEEKVEMDPLLGDNVPLDEGSSSVSALSMESAAANRQDFTTQALVPSLPEDASQQTRPVRLPWVGRSGFEETSPVEVPEKGAENSEVEGPGGMGGESPREGPASSPD